MALLCDEEIINIILGDTPLITGYQFPSNWYSIDSLVQPSSLDLHVGNIYIPPREEPKVGDQVDLRTEYNLMPGQAIVVDTLEILSLPNDIAAFGFPPTSISDRAILMTNPGHIDPGFRGKLSFTLINMGREPFLVAKDRTIVTLLLNKLDKPSKKDFNARRQGNPINAPTTHDLYRLGRDFLDLEKRTHIAAENAMRRENVRLSRMQVWLPIITALIAAVVAFSAASLQNDETVRKLRQQIGQIENQLDVQDRLKDLEIKFRDLSKDR